MARVEIFLELPRQEHEFSKIAESYAKEIGGRFKSRAEFWLFLRFLFTPKNKRWIFSGPGKTATTSVLNLLHFIEFGLPCTAKLADQRFLNESQAVHSLVNSGVFREVLARRDVPSISDFFQNAIYIASVRNPTTRALSAFRYLCKSNDIGSPQFLNERLRISAFSGFDWNRHTETEDGFCRFLDYIQFEVSNFGVGIKQPDNHWRPQHMDIRPDIFAPDILMKFEDFGNSAKVMFDLLGVPPIESLPQLNRSMNSSHMPDWLSGKIVRRKLRETYEKDYESFQYEV